MASNLIPEPDVQATNIQAGSGAQVRLDFANTFAMPDNSDFAGLSQTIASSTSALVNLNRLEENERKSREAWQEQLKNIHGLTEMGQLSEEDYMRIQREANAKAQKEGIIRAHENWSTMTAVSQERVRKLATAKTDFFKKHMGKLSNPDNSFRDEYGAVEAMFREEFADEPIGADSQGNPIYADTSRMTPMELVAYSNSESIQREAIGRAVQEVAAKRSLEASQVRGEQRNYELFDTWVQRSRGVSHWVNIPTVDPESETGEPFGNRGSQMLSAMSRGELTSHKTREEAEKAAQRRSDNLGRELDEWEAQEKKSALHHPTTGRKIHRTKDGERFSEVSETILDGHSQQLLDALAENASAMRDAGVVGVNDVVLGSINDFFLDTARLAELDDPRYNVAMLENVAELLQTQFSHRRDENGDPIMFAPEGTANNILIESYLDKAKTAYEASQKGKKTDMDKTIDLLTEKFRKRLSPYHADHNPEGATLEQLKSDRFQKDLVREFVGKAADAKVRGSELVTFSRDLDTFAGNIFAVDTSEEGLATKENIISSFTDDYTLTAGTKDTQIKLKKVMEEANKANLTQSQKTDIQDEFDATVARNKTYFPSEEVKGAAERAIARNVATNFSTSFHREINSRAIGKFASEIGTSPIFLMFNDDIERFLRIANPATLRDLGALRRDLTNQVLLGGTGVAAEVEKPDDKKTYKFSGAEVKFINSQTGFGHLLKPLEESLQGGLNLKDIKDPQTRANLAKDYMQEVREFRAIQDMAAWYTSINENPESYETYLDNVEDRLTQKQFNTILKRIRLQEE